jgi:two-component system, LuxR family, response regulator FixJ
MHEEPTVFVVDDEPILCQAMEFLFNSIGMKVRTFGSAREFLDDYDPAYSGCLLLDIRMPVMCGLELQKILRDRGIELPIIVITGHGDIQIAVETMKMGAVDFIEKPFRDQTLIAVVQKAIAIDRQKRQARQNMSEIKTQYDKLSDREKEVMRSVVAGKINKHIARELSLSQKTVEFHRSHVMRKMQAESLADLVKMANLIQETVILQ